MAPLTSLHVYYRSTKLAPYLVVNYAEAELQACTNPTDVSNSNSLLLGSPAKRSVAQEADAAAGGTSFQQRVSSFSNLLLTPAGRSFSNAAESHHRASQEATRSTGTPRYNRPRGGHSVTPLLPRSLPAFPPADPNQKIAPDWRLRDRMKTVGVGLIVALNVGTDPPDIVRPHPCAVLQCWMDPRKMSRAKAKELIGERLEHQYAKWQLARKGSGLKYRRALDPTVEDVRNLCQRLRNQARNERILLHYNGHGVPRPTDHGEIWVFDKNHTEYIPLAITELRQWMGKPAIVVLDCSSAGVLIPFLTSNEESTANNSVNSANATPQIDEQASHWVRDTIVLCPCSENEWLPMHPDYPADIFTSCLTTPIPMALRWFVNRNPASMSALNPDAVDAIPGKANDRKTPLGELNWIFTAVTDSIAWNILPKPLFARLFRQDLLVASMFRNFLLADRILRSLGCTPVCFPPLPPGCSDHPLWQAWDLACETLLFQLMQDGILGNHVLVPVKHQKNKNLDEEHGCGDSSTVATDASPPRAPEPEQSMVVASSVSSPFFSEQLAAFEVWLEFAEIHKIRLKAGGPAALDPPEHLPVVLQVLLSQVHRIQALTLLRRFLVLGPWAVNLALSLGIFPYVMKLLQSPEYKSLLVSIWASILAFDPSCRVDVKKDGALHHFVHHLMWGLNDATGVIEEAAKERTLAAFVLAAACHEYPDGQAECVRLNLHGNYCALLSSYEQGEHGQDGAVELHLPAHFRLWLCICLANLVKDNELTQTEAYAAGVQQRLALRMNDKNADVRAAVCYALGCMVGSQPKKGVDSRTPTMPSMQDLSFQMPQGQSVGFQPSPNMVHQHLAAASNMVAPGSVPSMSSLAVQLPATFAPTGVPNLLLRPQQLDPMWPMPVQPMTMQYLMHGQSLATHSSMGGPAGFLLGSGTILSPHGHPLPNLPQFHQHPQFPTVDTRQHIMKPTVFEDRHRLELDLSSIDILLQAVGDGSVVARYEATIALGVAVAKYLDAFIVVSEECSATHSAAQQTDEHVGSIFHPAGLERQDLVRFRNGWIGLKSLQREDPFPPIAKAANEIVSVVHENLLRVKLEAEERSRREDGSIRTGRLGGIDEERASSINADDLTSVPLSGGTFNDSISDRGLRFIKNDIRRVSSEGVYAKGEMVSMEEKALVNSSLQIAESGKQSDVMNYAFPKSEFYDWKKSAFDPNFEWLDNYEQQDPDPLSPLGATRQYQDRRNYLVREQGERLAQHYVSLAPKPTKPTKRSIEVILEDDDDTALLAAEEHASATKQELEFKEKRLFLNDGVKMTSLVAFHPYENYLMACGSADAVSLWDTESGKRCTFFNNGNSKDSRMTSSCWMNAESSSLFLVGCDDGTVKIWGDLIQNNGERSSRQPNLLSAFNAAPMQAGHWGSGLVTEWQPYSGTLIAGGNSKFIRCWDLEAEKVVNKLETKSDAYVTTLTTAWDYDSLGAGHGPQGYQGIGKDIIVAGLSDGSLKIFDVRTSNVVRRPKQRATSYNEHKSWVVTTAFTCYAGRFELISGTVAGEIKAWDLRMSSSIRTLDVQRSTMTTLAVHTKIPVVATGSEAQFIKIVALDGDTMQVLRYHEKLANHRIGPVSCLAFHPYKPLLAAGATDSYIGIYTTKQQTQQKLR